MPNRDLGLDPGLNSPENWKNIIKDRIDHFQTQEWQDYIDSHPYLILVHQTFSELKPSQFWRITSDHPDSVPKLNLQLRLMGNFGLQSSLPWLRADNSDKCLLCKRESETLYHFVLRCPYFKSDWIRFWLLLKNLINESAYADKNAILLFFEKFR